MIKQASFNFKMATDNQNYFSCQLIFTSKYELEVVTIDKFLDMVTVMAHLKRNKVRVVRLTMDINHSDNLYCHNFSKSITVNVNAHLIFENIRVNKITVAQRSKALK